MSAAQSLTGEAAAGSSAVPTTKPVSTAAASINSTPQQQPFMFSSTHTRISDNITAQNILSSCSTSNILNMHSSSSNTILLASTPSTIVTPTSLSLAPLPSLLPSQQQQSTSLHNTFDIFDTITSPMSSRGAEAFTALPILSGTKSNTNSANLVEITGSSDAFGAASLFGNSNANTGTSTINTQSESISASALLNSTGGLSLANENGGTVESSPGKPPSIPRVESEWEQFSGRQARIAADHFWKMLSEGFLCGVGQLDDSVTAAHLLCR